MQKISPRRASATCRVILADDQVIFRSGVARVLGMQQDISLLSQCDDPKSLLEMVAASRSCIIVVSQSLNPEMEPLFAAASGAGSRVILVTETGTSLHNTILRRLDGRLTRQTSADELLACVRCVHKGERVLTGSNIGDSVGDRIRDQLSVRELQIIGLVVQGCKNRRIAEEIGTSEQVVKNYLRGIYDKTGSSDRLELALFTLHHRSLAEAAARAVEQIADRTACV